MGAGTIRRIQTDVGSQGHVLRNCQAWQANKGLSKPDAIRKYVTKANELVEAYRS